MFWAILVVLTTHILFHLTLKCFNICWMDHYAHSHVPLRINCSNFSEPLESELLPSSGLNRNMSNTFNQIPAKLITFPSVSTTLCEVLIRKYSRIKPLTKMVNMLNKHLLDSACCHCHFEFINMLILTYLAQSTILPNKTSHRAASWPAFCGIVEDCPVD